MCKKCFPVHEDICNIIVLNRMDSILESLYGLRMGDDHIVHVCNMRRVDLKDNIFKTGSEKCLRD